MKYFRIISYQLANCLLLPLLLVSATMDITHALLEQLILAINAGFKFLFLGHETVASPQEVASMIKAFEDAQANAPQSSDTRED